MVGVGGWWSHLCSHKPHTLVHSSDQVQLSWQSSYTPCMETMCYNKWLYSLLVTIIFKQRDNYNYYIGEIIVLIIHLKWVRALYARCSTTPSLPFNKWFRNSFSCHNLNSVYPMSTIFMIFWKLWKRPFKWCHQSSYLRDKKYQPIWWYHE